ncbi:MAG: helix-turn-helix transcriptional regulator [Polyangiaceae bacterium]|nr:helix-turn-helix transcriptional regulator [Polyangiaceae bacterium]
MDILFRGDARGFSGSVVGTMTRALVTDAAPGVFVGVRFLPGEARRFLRFHAREAQDRVLRLEDVWGAPGRTLADRIAEAKTQRTRVALLEAALLAQRPHALPADGRVRRAVAALRSEGTRVAAVATEQALSARQLHRLFEEHVGAGPKVVARILRLRRALARKPTARASWAEVAADAGYADQAHLVRECRDLAGVTPSELARG